MIRDLSQLGDNFDQVLAIERRVEARLNKKGLLDDFNEEFKRYLKRGTFHNITNEELQAWKGPKNYITLHEVMKPSSRSTALRVILNSLLNNGNRGLSYNDCLPKGPNSSVPEIEATVAW